jgi:ATP-binding cassette, subfamily C, bacterial
MRLPVPYLRQEMSAEPDHSWSMSATSVREQLIDRSLALLPSTVERSGTGDLMTRSTTDVATMGPVLRDAAPQMLMAGIQVMLIAGAVFLLHPLLGLVALLVVPLMLLVTRWYLRRARAAYLAEGAADTEVSEELAATADGARTIEAFGMAGRRIQAGDSTVVEGVATRRRTLFLRSVFFPGLDLAFLLPLTACWCWGAACTWPAWSASARPWPASSTCSGWPTRWVR